MTTKKKPEPPPNLIGEEEESAARQRTLRQVRRLLTTTAIGSAALGYNCGSTVCDALPPPLECSAIQTVDDITDLYEQAEWAMHDGTLMAHLTAQRGYYDEGDRLVFDLSPTATGATVSDTELVEFDDGIEIWLTVDTGVTSVDVTLPFTCNALNLELRLRLDVSTQGGEGADIPLERI